MPERMLLINFDTYYFMIRQSVRVKFRAGGFLEIITLVPYHVDGMLENS